MIPDNLMDKAAYWHQTIGFFFQIPLKYYLRELDTIPKDNLLDLRCSKVQVCGADKCHISRIGFL